jgi:hypothetical protein
MSYNDDFFGQTLLLEIQETQDSNSQSIDEQSYQDIGI